MPTTSATLLERLRQPSAKEAWDRFVLLYAPILLRWARSLGLQSQDASDLVQDVFAVLVRQLPAFRYDPQKSFRAWLKTILLNAWRKQQRRRQGEKQAGGVALELACPDPLNELVDGEYEEHLVARALELARSEFQEGTWRACWEVVVKGRPAQDVATELGMTLNAVYLAKSRVLARLRRELDGLW